MQLAIARTAELSRREVANVKHEEFLGMYGAHMSCCGGNELTYVEFMERAKSHIATLRVLVRLKTMLPGASDVPTRDDSLCVLAKRNVGSVGERSLDVAAGLIDRDDPSTKDWIATPGARGGCFGPSSIVKDKSAVSCKSGLFAVSPEQALALVVLPVVHMSVVLHAAGAEHFTCPSRAGCINPCHTPLYARLGGDKQDYMSHASELMYPWVRDYVRFICADGGLLGPLSPAACAMAIPSHTACGCVHDEYKIADILQNIRGCDHSRRLHEFVRTKWPLLDEVAAVSATMCKCGVNAAVDGAACASCSSLVAAPRGVKRAAPPVEPAEIIFRRGGHDDRTMERLLKVINMCPETLRALDNPASFERVLLVDGKNAHNKVLGFEIATLLVHAVCDADEVAGMAGMPSAMFACVSCHRDCVNPYHTVAFRQVAAKRSSAGSGGAAAAAGGEDDGYV